MNDGLNGKLPHAVARRIVMYLLAPTWGLGVLSIDGSPIANLDAMVVHKFPAIGSCNHSPSFGFASVKNSASLVLERNLLNLLGQLRQFSCSSSGSHTCSLRSRSAGCGSGSVGHLGKEGSVKKD